MSRAASFTSRAIRRKGILERRLGADIARAVARAWAVGDTTVERHADEADVDLIKPHAVGEAEEGWNSTIARLQLWIGQF
jgi:hypothetical protein